MTQYREVPEDKILKFSATPSFKGWGAFFSEDSVSHPAKMNLNLLRYILKTYTEKGDVVLDPMAGTGSTIILASNMGRHGVAVEYEAKFCKMIDENIYLLEKQVGFVPRGKAICIEGDARELSKHLIESDVIISSPPYGNRLSDVAIHDGDLARMGYRQTVDVVLTSPPYSDSQIGGGEREKRVGRLEEALATGEKISDRSLRWLNNQKKGVKERTQFDKEKGYSENPKNIGNLPHGKIDSIITSPPYGSDNANLQGRRDESAKSVLASTGVRSVDLDPENLGNLEYGDIDAVVMSPPYESAIRTGREESPRFDTLIEDETSMGHSSKSISLGYSEDSNNIGNLKGETYLEAMLRVYQESFKVLKPLGKMVLVTKNFIRNKQVVRLDIDTIKLCKSVGFKLTDHLYFKLPTKSFWKILYEKKYPNVPEVLYEDVLVFEKSAVVVPPNRRSEE